MSGAPIHSISPASGARHGEKQAILTPRVLAACTTVILFVAPFAASAGVRGAMLAAAGVALLAHWRESAERLRATFPRTVLGAVIAWAALASASVAWSIAPRFSAGELRPEVLYPIAALVVFFLAAREALVRPWAWALATGSALATIGVLLQPQWIPPSVSRHPVDGGPGYLSTHLVLVAPALFAAILAGVAHRRRRIAYAALAFVVVALCAWQTANRIVWLAFAAQIATAVLAWRSGEHPGHRRSRIPLVIALACAAVAVAAFLGSIVEREEQVARYAIPEGSIESDLRPKIWEVAFERFRDAPWLGHGFGREILHSAFEPLTPHEIDHPLIQHAHNVFADVSLQLGLVGLAVFVWLLLALAGQYGRFLSRPETVAIGVAGLAALAGFVVKNLTDDFFHRHNALVFWCLQGALLGLARRRDANARD